MMADEDLQRYHEEMNEFKADQRIEEKSIKKNSHYRHTGISFTNRLKQRIQITMTSL